MLFFFILPASLHFIIGLVFFSNSFSVQPQSVICVKATFHQLLEFLKRSLVSFLIESRISQFFAVFKVQCSNHVSVL